MIGILYNDRGHYPRERWESRTMSATITGVSALFVLFLGLVNWVATEIVVTSIIFKDIREWTDNLGMRLKKRHPRTGEKLCYFLKCALCVGVWIGFVEALVFDGPLHSQLTWIGWAAFVANGLLYKGVGHLLLQVNAWFHHRIDLMKVDVQMKQREIALLDNDARPEPASARQDA